MSTASPLATLETPAALVDLARLQHNIAHMQQRLTALGVALRPHIKTSKCAPVVAAQIAAGARGVTVSTLKEAAQCFATGITDITYAVGIAPAKLAQVLALRRQGCALKILTDNSTSARAIAEFGRAQGEAFEVLIEIDTDGHRSGIPPESDELLAVGRALHEGGQVLTGVLTHAGASYQCSTPEALAAIAEQERALCVRAAQRLREAGLPCPVVSVGSTPTALSARQLDGVTEVRAGVYVFMDLVMCNVGVCSTNDVALSVLATVIGHQLDKGWVLVDAGWMAMSRDRGTQAQAHDYGYGQVCDAAGRMLPGWTMSGANQEHGILSNEAATAAGTLGDLTTQFPVGTLLRLLPNHACATAAQFDHYHALGADGSATVWPRWNHW
ncbi:MAG: alanine racemase [Burkholderiales bacterium RIFCSPHIGHO2_12_FULL_69_20]|nr:MAG: alanine racemase [Burkholderiales bacterium RIFCSPHIGHO2_12_FULL_69_20]